MTSSQSNSLSVRPVRIVPDTRVKSFTYEEALNWLMQHNHLYCEFTYDVFRELDPEQDLIEAFDEWYMPIAYAENENKYSETLEEV